MGQNSRVSTHRSSWWHGGFGNGCVFEGSQPIFNSIMQDIRDEDTKLCMVGAKGLCCALAHITTDCLLRALGSRRRAHSTCPVGLHHGMMARYSTMVAQCMVVVACCPIHANVFTSFGRTWSTWHRPGRLITINRD